MNRLEIMRQIPAIGIQRVASRAAFGSELRGNLLTAFPQAVVGDHLGTEQGHLIACKRARQDMGGVDHSEAGEC